ncbi:unnamed protein product [Strongylus vulgaris]|uniref:Uncharacterized protein n=1 Tax=Strongylus vulgaris TaxID=40348 RepID=A0A3P7JD06_STRVU|nr:unnamed protein product [Strongylus vulgaris]
MLVLFAEAFPPLNRDTFGSMKTQQRYDYSRAAGFMDGKLLELKLLITYIEVVNFIPGILLVQKPRNVGSTYWNYKGFHSVILLAVRDCDHGLWPLILAHQDELEMLELLETPIYVYGRP